MRDTKLIAARIKTSALAGAVAAVALTFAAVGAHAAPIAVTFNPGIVVPGSPVFTADTLNLKDYALTNLSGSNFTESGYLQVNNANLGSNLFTPTGLNSTYSLYLQYNATGTQSAPSFNQASLGMVSTLSYTLYEAAGDSIFSITGNSPTVVGGPGTALATGSLINGTTTFTTSPLGAGANITASFIQQLAGFIVSPANATLTLAGAFNNDSNIINVFNNGNSFTLNGGGGDLTFTSTPISTPEPVSLALLGSGLIGLGAIRARSRKAK